MVDGQMIVRFILPANTYITLRGHKGNLWEVCMPGVQ